MACFALIWIVHRALVQSITLDEADTFNHWVAPTSPAHWEPHSNNHVLNSTLMRLSIWLFGLSPLTVRMPALLGGLLYIFAMYRLCALLTNDLLLAWALFVCLVYNPFIMDYLVAARGYGLALGFLGLAIYLLAREVVRTNPKRSEGEILSYAAAISACVGLSICANFSFALVCGSVLLVAGSLSWVWMFGQNLGARAWARLALRCLVPVFMILLILAGSALTHFPRKQLFWGADSLKYMFLEIRSSSFLELNPYLVNPLLANFFHKFEGYAVILFTVSVTLYLVMLLVFRRQLRESSARSRLLLAGSLASVLAFAVGAHWLQFKLLKIPLPLERTSIWIVPLFVAAIGTVLSVAPSHRMQGALRGLGVVSLAITAFYFIGELRDSYFHEWKSCAEVKTAFPVIVDLCRRANVREVPSNFNVTPSLNFYKSLYKVSDIDQFSNFEKMPLDKSIYVLEESQYADFIRAEGLQIAWHGSASDLVVLVRPGTLGLKHSDGQPSR